MTGRVDAAAQTRTQIRGDSGLKGPARDWARLCQMLCRGGELDGVRVLSRASVMEMASSSVGGRLLEPPFGFQGGVATPRYQAPPTEPAFRVAEADEFKLRPFNCTSRGCQPGMRVRVAAT